MGHGIGGSGMGRPGMDKYVKLAALAELKLGTDGMVAVLSRALDAETETRDAIAGVTHADAKKDEVRE